MESKALMEQVEQTIRAYQMLQPGDHVIVGVSGGADSVCLLTVLRSLQEKIPFSMRVVHVHHGLRQAADQDEAYVKALCRTWDIPCIVVHVDAAEYARAHGETVEEAGRNLRQQAFASAAKSWREEDPEAAACKVALAHHVEDLAETVLFNLCRGTGIAGLRGILPVSDGRIRPLIAVNRAEIETYLEQQNISWRTDESNEDLEITRNYLRKAILPGLQAEVNTGTISHIARLAQDAAEVEAYLAEITEAAYKKCLANTTTGSVQKGALSITKLQMEPVFLRKRILHLFLTKSAERKKDIGEAHVDVLCRLMNKQGSGTADLPYGLTAYREYDALWLEEESLRPAEEPADDVPFPQAEEEYEMRIFSYDGEASVPRGKYTKWLDYDKMTAFPVFRTRRPGDRITIADDGTSKQITRYMIDVKIPKRNRDRFVLPAKDQEILWIPGYQINAAYKVTKTTKRVLEISWSKGVEIPEGKEDHG